MAIEFLPCGDCALSVQFGTRVDRALSRRVLALHAALGRHDVPGVVEAVPTFRSLLVHYDPLRTSQADLKAAIGPLADTAEADETAGAHLRLPVCYEPSLAPDIADVAAMAKISPQELAGLHSETTHYVYALGFAPGQPYMGDLPEQLHLPRRKDPRAEVATGTVANATGLTVVYPFANPCGWHVIGRTPVALFDPARSPANLVSPGDTVECYPIGLEEFERLQAEAAEGASS
ncbi:MAG: 5-oxoprolinase subunit PxpB [Hyphomicrobiales bacterium]